MVAVLSLTKGPHLIEAAGHRNRQPVGKCWGNVLLLGTGHARDRYIEPELIHICGVALYPPPPSMLHFWSARHMCVLARLPRRGCFDPSSTRHDGVQPRAVQLHSSHGDLDPISTPHSRTAPTPCFCGRLPAPGSRLQAAGLPVQESTQWSSLYGRGDSVEVGHDLVRHDLHVLLVVLAVLVEALGLVARGSVDEEDGEEGGVEERQQGHRAPA